MAADLERLRGADSPEVAGLAADMSAGRQSEIDAMQDMLRARGLPREPGGAAPVAGEEDGAAGPAAPTHVDGDH